MGQRVEWIRRDFSSKFMITMKRKTCYFMKSEGGKMFETLGMEYGMRWQVTKYGCARY